MSLVDLALDSILFMLFLTTALDKILHFSHHAAAMDNYRLLPPPINRPFLIIFTIWECFLCYSFITSQVGWFNMIAAVALLLIYTGAVLINLLRGHTDIDCGCGSILENERLSYGMVRRNLFLILMIVTSFLIESHVPLNFGLFSRIWMIIFACGVLLVVATVKEYRSQLHVFRFIKKFD